MFVSKIYPWNLNSIHEHIVILQCWAYFRGWLIFKGGPIFKGEPIFKGGLFSKVGLFSRMGQFSRMGLFSRVAYFGVFFERLQYINVTGSMWKMKTILL